jgi:hypothetical protein
MDELRQLRQFRAEETSESPQLDRARSALLEEIESAGTSAGQRRSRNAERRVVERRRLSERFRTTPPQRAEPFARRWTVLAAAALVLIVVAVIALPSDSGGPSQAAAALKRVGTVAGLQNAETPPGRGQYLYTRTVSNGLSGQATAPIINESRGGTLMVFYGPDAFEDKRGISDLRQTLLEPGRSELRGTEELWLASDGSGRALDHVGGLDPDSPTAKALDAYRKKGFLDASFKANDSDAGAPAYRDLSEKSTVPDQLREQIESGDLKGPFPHSGDRAAVTYDTVLDLLGAPAIYAPPKVRAALFEVAAQLPGVELVGEVTDPVGRPGVAVGLTNNGIRREMIFDPRTAALLAERDVVEDPDFLGIDVKPGAVIGYQAFLTSGVVDSTSQRPDQNRLQGAPAHG